MDVFRSDRGTFRNRRGKDRYRAPLISERLQRKAPLSRFEQVVASTCHYMRTQWAEDLGELNWVIEDAGPIVDGVVQKFSVNRETMTITLYRVPIERFMHPHRTSAEHERVHIEQIIFEAVDQMMGRS